MEAVIFCGIQASGKTTFFKDRFFKTHIRLSLDQLKTRSREAKFLDICIQTKQPFVVDNTNPSKTDRARYISQAKEKKFKIIGYYFDTGIAEALERNSLRQGKECIPVIGIIGTANKMEIPSFEEGFDELYLVEIVNGGFSVKTKERERFLNKYPPPSPYL